MLHIDGTYGFMGLINRPRRRVSRRRALPSNNNVATANGRATTPAVIPLKQRSDARLRAISIDARVRIRMVLSIKSLRFLFSFSETRIVSVYHRSLARRAIIARRFPGFSEKIRFNYRVPSCRRPIFNNDATTQRTLLPRDFMYTFPRFPFICSE